MTVVQACPGPLYAPGVLNVESFLKCSMKAASKSALPGKSPIAATVP